MNTKTLVCGILLGISHLGFAQQQTDSLQIQELDEVVVSDSRFNLKRENSGKVITKITQKELNQLQGRSIADIINMTAGIEINGTRSNAGQNLSYFVRGGRNRQVLVLIDGVPVTDASQIANDYDLRLLNADQVESIEILKGASSTLYGTGAATAVINIKLKQEAKDTFSVNLRSTIGTNQSQDDSDYDIENFLNSVSVSGTVDKFSYMATFGQQFTDGLSAIANGDESDAFNSHNGFLKLGYRFSDKFRLATYASFDKFKADFDDSFGLTDADNRSITDQHRYGLNSEFKYNKGSITLNAAYNTVDRDIESGFPSRFKAQSFKGDLFNRYNFNDKFYTVLGVNAQRNEIESFSIPFGETQFQQSINPEDATFTIVDPYINAVYVSDFGLNINAGLRLNNHSEYGTHLVYSLNPSFRKDTNFGYVKGLASYSTSFITPSLFQLFEPSFGNADLEPEENRTIEVGAEVHIKDKATISVVYFDRLEENFVDFVDQGDFVFQYDNTNNDFTASGIELVADVKVTENLQFRANGTYTKVDESLNLRIPEIKVNAALNYTFKENTNISLMYQFNDDRDDAFFNSDTFESETVNLSSYSLLDASISHEVLKNRFTVFANFNNILNEAYEELFGFATRGRNINIGFTLSL
ncbi:TonB-dependent receptor plug domain-containing protein [Psychroserpens sp.]|uniref:TonB-dependent receptor plug domain-containing protein n=1 Tax=Psychroserpens sp. TaxID=2020870 RepID=UPI001B0FB8A4|nr:TonB-dependent receptor plug domain-containing protein [Psychroserpens sp.]MBO6607067.1 TonB-dependent receptor [Psychroserpens sp.]MBO6654213.1 TonB-dependent receptor [Psychroserpens sp.]MBO6682501.1 TonB-dependent receptor [Psychroserpens sp.]MBO6750839.1 TonB-dependent receptor [Psychroserpens sp.]MBO6915732.1 TonB-dependent receptor [Psychroserpens sp.]